MTAAVKGAVTVRVPNSYKRLKRAGESIYGRRRIWLIIIGILIAGVSITWAVERFVSSRGVDTAAVVGFEADALPQGPVDAGNPYAVENRMKAAGTPDPQTPEDAEVSALAMAARCF